MQSEKFGRLLKVAINSIAGNEGKSNPVIEDELGQQIGVSAASIQRYKAGHIPPETRTIEVFAEVAVKRGYLNRDWLYNFLKAAQYPTWEKLLDKLCPTHPTHPRPARVYQNLPSPTYSQFVMREQAFAEVLDGLNQRSAVVLIASLGGMGKTSLAREIASYCLKEESEPHFDAAVWVSDKDRPGTTNLSTVLDEIARTLDYPGYTQFEYTEKRYEVEQLLRRQKVLIVIDNFETISDEVLLAWLLRLPEPSKALLTTREYRREFRRNTYPIDLRGMNDIEAAELISQRLRQLKIDKLITDQNQLTPLIAITGGNPKALEIALGCIKYQRQPIQQVVDDLYAARGELFDDLFTRCWSLLDEATNRVLLAMPIFVGSASEEALSTTADVKGFAFDRAIERLTDLALLDIQQADLSKKPRYILHPLVRAFALAKMTLREGFDIAAIERWAIWFKALASKISTYGDYSKELNSLDLEQETAYVVIRATLNSGQYQQTIELSKMIDHYFYVRGYWDKNLGIHQMRQAAARKLNDLSEELKVIAYQIQLFSKQGNFKEAEILITRLKELVGDTALPSDLRFEIQHGLALFYFGQNQFQKAEEAWSKMLAYTEELKFWKHIAIRRWLAACLFRRGLLNEAKQLLEDALKDALLENYSRGLVAIQNRLAEIALAEQDTKTARAYLSATLALSISLQDRRNMAITYFIYAQLYLKENDQNLAYTAILQAIDHFEKVGMQPELAEARQELANMEAKLDRLGENLAI